MNFTVKTSAGTSEYIIDFMNNDKPTILFTEGLAQKQPDSQTPKSDFELELIGFIKYKGNTLKGSSCSLFFSI